MYNDYVVFRVGDVVRLRRGTKPMIILELDGDIATCRYKSQHPRHPKQYVHNVNKIIHFNSEEPEMKKPQESQDVIFETLVSDTYYMVEISLQGSHCESWNYRVSNLISLAVGSIVVVEGNCDRSPLLLGTVVGFHKNNNYKSAGWVIQKVDTSDNDLRQSQWKVLYEGIEHAEVERKREMLTKNYGAELAKYSPEAALALRDIKKDAEVAKPSEESVNTETSS